MKRVIQYLFTIVFFSFFFTGCKVGITPLEQNGNELNVVTTGTPDRDGNVETINIDIPDIDIPLDVSVELYGDGSEYFTIALDKNAHGYQGEVTLNPNHPHPVVYVDKTYTFFARTVVNGQKLCKASVKKTILHTEVPPVAEDINVTLDERASILVELNATDENRNDTLTYHIIRKPKYGTVLLPENSASATYTDINSSGADSFTYVAYDGKMFSNIATVNIDINALPDTTPPMITLIGTDVNLTVGESY
ncbi:MAG TPA: hypothetical protein ENK98_00790, partial [Epsilonproteobacteria bacterium]|nr:hypothetical protein [Campylobacterota bacterium]